MSELRDHLERLAERGTTRGADAVVAGALARAGFTSAAGDLEVLPVALADEMPPRERRRWRSAFTAGGIAALVGVATLAVSALVGSGGSDSPEGAVRQLADAISHEDPLAAVAVLAPDEVQTLRDTLGAASAKAAELELVEAASAPLAGLDLSVDGLSLETQELAPGYAKVVVRGATIGARVERSGFSELVQRAMGGDVEASKARVDLVAEPPFAVEPFVVAVERDDGWYVSAAYTVLEYIRVVNGLAPAEYGAGVASAATLGAASPEEAARAMLDAVAAGDWPRVFALLPPGEVPLYDYRAALDELIGDEASPGWRVDEFSATTEVDGDTAIVTAYARVDQGEEGTFELADDCASFISFVFSEETEWCVGVPTVVPLGEVTSSGAHSVRVEAVRREGRWFLSPVGTAIDYLDRGVLNVDERWLYSVLGLAHELEPDATLALGTPVDITRLGAAVYAFDGRAGLEVVGRLEDPTGTVTWGVEPAVYSPDGARLEESWGVLSGEPLRLPVDGTYKLVVQTLGRIDARLTLWDADDAPADALDPPEWADYEEECRVVGDGIECSSGEVCRVEGGGTICEQEVTVTPTTRFAAGE